MPIMIQSLYEDTIKEKQENEDVILSQTMQWFGAGTGIYEDRKNKKKKSSKSGGFGTF